MYLGVAAGCGEGAVVVVFGQPNGAGVERGLRKAKATNTLNSPSI